MELNAAQRTAPSTAQTTEQRQVAEHGTGPLRIRGRAGTGKSTALVARYLRLAGHVAPSRILFLARSREAAAEIRDAVLPQLAGGFDALPITTFAGLAFDILDRAGARPHRISAGEQRALVRDLLADEDPADWPALGHLLRRPAFVDEVRDGLIRWRTEVGAPGAGPDGAWLGDAWRELLAFSPRYDAALDARDAVDGAGLLTQAAVALQTQESAAYEHVLVDDFETATPAAARLLAAVGAGAASVCVSANPGAAFGGRWGASAWCFESLPGTVVELTDALRGPPSRVVVRCPHPSVEPEAVAGELLAAREAGIRWSDMAVLVRHPRRRARAITRALARHAIPASAPDAPVQDEPVVTAAVDLLRWAAGDDTVLSRLLASPLSGLDPVDVRTLRRRLAGSTPHGAPGGDAHGNADATRDLRLAALVALRAAVQERLEEDPASLLFLVWERALGPLLVASNDPADDRAIDAFVSFHDSVSRQVDRNPALRVHDWLASLDGGASGYRTTRPDTDAVTVRSIEAAAGRSWHTVVVAGAVEGELPSIDGHAPVFEAALLAGRPPPTPAERRRASLSEERRLFCEVATTRATTTLVATAGPELGVLESRFVGDWPVKAPVIPLAPGRPPLV
ncbi:MAG: ATP-dependent helicase, partial [Acidimicrobiia bacterium]|nr:ATP-dependent helicase [Acidimicrobiia bacterium]